MISLGAKFFHRLYLHAGSGGVAMFALSLVSLDQCVLRVAQHLPSGLLGDTSRDAPISTAVSPVEGSLNSGR